MTVAPQGDFKRMLDDAILNDEEHLLRRINLCCWKDKVSEAVPAILARARDYFEF